MSIALLTQGLKKAAGGSAPTYQAISSTYNNTDAGTLAWPTHATNDVGVLITCNRYTDGPVATPSGWTAMAFQPVGAGPNTDDTMLGMFWRRADSASQAAVNISDGATNAQRTLASMLTFRGCVTTGTPFAEVGSNDSGTPTASVSINGGATGGNDRLVFFALAIQEIDQDTSALSAGFTNGDLTSVTNRLEFNVLSNAGYGLYAGTGLRAASATIGATTATLSASVNWAGGQIALIGT